MSDYATYQELTRLRILAQLATTGVGFFGEASL